MIKRLIFNDIKNHKLLSVSTVLFMTASTMLFSLAAMLFATLSGSVDKLMETAVCPDFLQMHSGDIELEKIDEFAKNNPSVDDYQVSGFLNIDNNIIYLGDTNLSDSTQDNGLCVQNERFDFLIDMENNIPRVSEGEVYVPACYKSMYDINVSDTMKILDEELRIAGFIRDSQMSSMMASSKRFLVNKADYDRIKKIGSEEYLIEFLLTENMDTNLFSTDYSNALPYTNGPQITKPLIKLMNVLTDGIMIFIILLTGVAVLLISLLCIKFITSISVEKDKPEAGMLKAIGVSDRNIRFLYFAKYILLSVVGSVLGIIGAFVIRNPLSIKLQESYGATNNYSVSIIIAVIVSAVVEIIILLFINKVIKSIDKMSALEALFSVKSGKKEKGQQVIIAIVIAICVGMTLLTENLSSTLASPDFVTYMGIGDAKIRMDIRGQKDIIGVTNEQIEKLKNDTNVDKFAPLKTVSRTVTTKDNEEVNLLIETGEHGIFPVKYSEGAYPDEKGEIALSALLATQLSLNVNDTINIDGPYKVCGIYSDITNGGKTAKVKSFYGDKQSDGNVIWSVIYVSLKDETDVNMWIEKYNTTGVETININDYVNGTYGQTIAQIEKAKYVAFLVASIIIAVVVLLFIRLLIEKRRYKISLKKALGFNDLSLIKSYIANGILPVITGVISGVLVGTVLGEKICAIALMSFGATGFKFSIQPVSVTLISGLFLIISISSVYVATLEIKNIKAYECCIKND